MNMPHIYVALDNQQVEHQSNMIEVEDMISNIPTSILINSGESYSYINPNLVAKCNLESNKLLTYRMVRMETRLKRKITSMVKIYRLNLNGL